jgi:hypothetical protein
LGRRWFRSAQACATGAANAVDIVIGVVRHVEIENMADRWDIETARSDIGSDQHRDLALRNDLRRCASRLVHVAVQRRRVKFVAQQRAVVSNFTLAIAKTMAFLKLVASGSAAAVSHASCGSRPVETNNVNVRAVVGLGLNTHGIMQKRYRRCANPGGMVAVKKRVCRERHQFANAPISGMKPCRAYGRLVDDEKFAAHSNRPRSK